MADHVEKRKVNVNVAGKLYTLVTNDDQAYVNRVADIADRTLRETAMATRQSIQQAGPLAVISLADELVKSRDQITFLERELTRLRQALEEAEKKAKA